MRLTSNKKILIISLICFLLALLLIFFVIFPIILKTKADYLNLAGAKKELASYDKKSEELEKAKENYEKWKPSLDKADSLFINSDVPLDFIKFMENTASLCELKIDITSSREQKKDSDVWKSISFQLNIAGKFENVLKFLSKMESSAYLVDPQSINIQESTVQSQKSEDNISLREVKAVLEIKTYAN